MFCEDVFSLSLDQKFTHVLLTEGFFQHFALSTEQTHILRVVKNHLAKDGFVSIDITLPPSEKKWTILRSKEWRRKKIYQTVEGETSLNKQLFHTSITYETYENSFAQSKYRVDRDYSLLLPREVAYLLQCEGFKIIDMIENYQVDLAANTSLIPSLIKKSGFLKKTESLSEISSLKERCLHDYHEGVWGNGGYPLPIVNGYENYSNKWTIIATLPVEGEKNEIKD